MKFYQPIYITEEHPEGTYPKDFDVSNAFSNPENVKEIYPTADIMLLDAPVSKDGESFNTFNIVDTCMIEIGVYSASDLLRLSKNEIFNVASQKLEHTYVEDMDLRFDTDNTNLDEEQLFVDEIAVFAIIKEITSS